MLRALFMSLVLLTASGCLTPLREPNDAGAFPASSDAELWGEPDDRADAAVPITPLRPSPPRPPTPEPARPHSGVFSSCAGSEECVAPGVVEPICVVATVDCSQVHDRPCTPGSHGVCADTCELSDPTSCGFPVPDVAAFVNCGYVGDSPFPICYLDCTEDLMGCPRGMQCVEDSRPGQWPRYVCI